MADNFITLYNRLLNRAPQVGNVLAKQLVNDSWHELQAKEEWSWRRHHGCFAPPGQYIDGIASTNVGAGNPTLVTGVGTAWTSSMIGRQIRIGGLLYPYYTIVAVLSPTDLLLDSPWSGLDVSGQVYQIIQIYYPVPEDFGYFYVATSVKDAYRIYTNITEAELALLDPQRGQQGQVYAAAMYDFSSQFGGVVGPVIPVTSPTDPAPISTTATGFTYVTNATYIIQIVTPGIVGTATFQWMRAGQVAFTGPVITSATATDLSDGVQIYFPAGTYVAGDIFIINCVSLITQGTPRYELWPSPTFSTYLYPYIYIAKEYDLSDSAPTLPPFVANRGEILLEMALLKAATFPGADAEHPNPYFDLRLAGWHRDRVDQLMIEFRNNDQNVGINALDYQNMPFGGPFTGPYGVWYDGAYQQRHAIFLD